MTGLPGCLRCFSLDGMPCVVTRIETTTNRPAKTAIKYVVIFGSNCEFFIAGNNCLLAKNANGPAGEAASTYGGAQGSERITTAPQTRH